jgi:hypothetical protein
LIIAKDTAKADKKAAIHLFEKKKKDKLIVYPLLLNDYLHNYSAASVVVSASATGLQ